MLEKQYGKNEVIFREGDYGDRFYQIESGRVGVFAHYGEAARWRSSRPTRAAQRSSRWRT